MSARAIVLSTFVWLVALNGCDDNACGHPDQVEYSCMPVAPGTPGTCGPLEFRGMTYGEGMAFPDGCRISLPMCVEAFPESVQTCDCSAVSSGSWACPI